MELDKSIRAHIRKGEGHYVASCLEIAVVTQGSTLDETVANLREAVCLYLEDEDLDVLGIAQDPRILITMELGPARA